MKEAKASRLLVFGGLAGVAVVGGIAAVLLMTGLLGGRGKAKAVASRPVEPPRTTEAAAPPVQEAPSERPAPPEESPAPEPPTSETPAPPETPAAETPASPEASVPPETPPPAPSPPPETPPPPEEQPSPEEQLRRHVRAEMAACESFPFTITAVDVAGREQSLESLRGKVVLVDLWGTWCPPCRAEIPSFIRLQDELGPQGLQVLGVNFERGQSPEENAKVVTDFIAEQRVNYPCILGDGGIMQQVPNLRGFPTTLFIDRSGKVRLMAVGARPHEYLAAVVSELLAEPDAGAAGVVPGDSGGK